VKLVDDVGSKGRWADMIAMISDRNLLVAGFAVRAGFVDCQQFTEIYRLGEEKPDQPLENTLFERGWIQAEDRASLAHLVRRALDKHRGNVREAMASMAQASRLSLAALEGLDSESTMAGSPSTAISAQPEIPQAVSPLDHRYAFASLHATGGIGRVWLAQDHQLEREVAVKELLPDKAANARLAARFLREARLTGQLEHPGIVPVYELTIRPDNNQPFYTMRFVRGRTLLDAINAYHDKRSAGETEPPEFLSLLASFVAVCNTIAYAHSRGVVHRDLKGANVMLGDFGEVIVLDWGLAKQLNQPDPEPAEPASVAIDEIHDPSLTVQGEIVGTPAYMAPEQAQGRLDQIDQRTDIYGLGAMLYEILTGRPPFVGATTVEVLHKAVRGDFSPPRELWSDVPPPLEEACLKALAADPNERFSRAEDLAQEVQRWQDTQRRRAEEALRASEQQYRSLADLIPGVVWTAQADGSVDYANQFWLDFTGMTMEQSLGSGWAAALHPDDVGRVSEVWSKALASGELLEVNYRLRRADGIYRWFLARGKSLRDRDGRVIKWFGMLTEIDGVTPEQAQDRAKANSDA
jgi:PAS domain S-box-containing protein